MHRFSSVLRVAFSLSLAAVTGGMPTASNSTLQLLQGAPFEWTGITADESQAQASAYRPHRSRSGAACSARPLG